MVNDSENKGIKKASPIYIISGGAGASGKQVVDSVLVQYPDADIKTIVLSNIRQPKQIQDIIKRAVRTNGTIVHTMVNEELRLLLNKLGAENNILTIDLMGSMFDRINLETDMKPLSMPGLYRRLHQSYFDRIDAIEFTVNHDDGKNPQDLHLADIVLVGVSRSGKTPLSMYLAVLGWRIANIPIVSKEVVPPKLYEIDRNRVFGLVIEHDQLMMNRRKRQERMGLNTGSSYTDPETVFAEMEIAEELLKKHQYSKINVTNKPIESSASEIVEIMTNRFSNQYSDR